MIDCDTKAYSYINNNPNNIKTIIIDEKAIKINPINYLNKISTNIPSICIYNTNTLINKDYGNLICLSKSLVNNYLKNNLRISLSKSNNKSKYNLIGNSKSFKRTINEIQELSKTKYPIHLSGETGTGKTLIANIIHENRDFYTKELQYLNCSDLNSTLMETLLFGNTKGAYTGANEEKIGIIEKSNNTDLFLDEIGNLPLAAQERLLTVLDSKQFRVVGGNIKKSNFSLITASNEDLNILVKENRMRLDFYYRIETFEIKVPSLRERKEDIPLLINFYLKEFNEKRKFKEIDLEKLINRKWEGNIRELIKVLQRSSVLSKKDYLEIK